MRFTQSNSDLGLLPGHMASGIATKFPMSRCAHLRCFDFVAFPCSIGFAFIAFFLGMGSQGFCVFCRRRPSELDDNVAMYPHEKFLRGFEWRSHSTPPTDCTCCKKPSYKRSWGYRATSAACALSNRTICNSKLYDITQRA